MIMQDVVCIDSSPEVVWKVTRDIERWPEWTPTVTSATLLGPGEFGLGASVKIKQPGQPAARWVVTAFESGRRFTWETRRPGLHMIASHEIAPAGSGAQNTLVMEVNGILAFFLRPMLRRTILRALSEENAGLKQRCEEIARLIGWGGRKFALGTSLDVVGGVSNRLGNHGTDGNQHADDLQSITTDCAVNGLETQGTVGLARLQDVKGRAR